MTLNSVAGEPAQKQKPRQVATSLGRSFGRWSLAIPAVAFLCAGGCADSVRAVVDGPTDRATKVEEVSDAIAARFTNPERSGRFEQTRRKLISGALHPSRVFSDTSLWTTTSGTTARSLWAYGSLTPRGYRFDVTERGVLNDLGDTRHAIMLRKHGDGDYQWTTGVDFAIGSITARDVGAMLELLLTAGQGHDGHAVRSATATSFPRTAAVMSKLFRIDSLSLRPGPQGTTVVNLAVGIHTEILRQTAPHFADYLAKYVDNSKYRFLVTDKSGVPYFEAKGANRKLTI